jgi:hypothetical protein
MVQQVGDGEVAQQHGQKEEEGEQRKEEVIGELHGPAEVLIPPGFRA